MATHMLVQMPLLFVLGIVLAQALTASMQQRLVCLAGGVLPLVLLGILTLAYWMIPRSLDRSLDSSVYEMAKFLSLPLFAGLPLGLSWSRLSTVGRGLIQTHGISMLAVVGWLYIVAPQRLCNQYLSSEQFLTGQAMVTLAGCLLLWWVFSYFFPQPRTK